MAKDQALINREETALIIIDVQQRLAPVVKESEKLIAFCARLAQFAAIAKVSVIATEQMKLGSTVDAIATKLPPGSSVIEKITFDCFAEDSFVKALDQIAPKTLVLCGIESHICVLQTALSAVKNYRVQVIADAVSSRWDLDKQVALSRMALAGVEIVSSEMFIYEILRKAGTDEFRQTLPLVKEPPA